MQLGCSTILYGGQSLPTALKQIQAAGYPAVELCTIPGMAPHLDLGADAAYYQGICSQIADLGLVIESVGASGRMGDREVFLRVLDAAQAIGAPLVTTGPGGKADDSESFRSVVDTINALAEEAAQRDVRLSIKPHVNQAVYNTATALEFMNHVDADRVGLNYDPTHIWRTPEQEVPEETMGALVDHMFSGRIRDVKGRQMAIGAVENQIAGNGDLNLKGIAEQFKKADRLDFVVLEIVGTKEMSVEDVGRVIRLSYEGLNGFFN
jgi:sugar phosphate isomerase/epimerase